MKKLALAVIALIGLTVQAQEKKMEREKLTPEQRVELQVKKMTLDLDLNEKQQKEVKTLLTARHKKMEEARAKRQATKTENKKPTSEERFAMKSKMLDEQIAFKNDMKKILSEKQMAKWEERKADRSGHRMERKRMMHHKSEK
ncbi:hypothetical protein [Flavobacterium suncheonense]|uniref:DUF4890 domain-containing protein n=1 Tax=Flavobacterium suncheonense GH29-5 = DSM 17707 TaxID=1121899 RepID=A0A0A2M9A8_9FLAO|nr:hypothetical protein [Flavobacterium suncheonense]KGO88859.1 hypothetical protein Q764_10600 [Flavobacterium suncheonense GH29-5 = DSM 17707]